MIITNLPIKQILVENTRKLYKYKTDETILNKIEQERSNLFEIFTNLNDTYSPEEMDLIHEGGLPMVKYRIVQMGSERSIVECLYLDTKEKHLEMINNDYLMLLDGYGYVL